MGTKVLGGHQFMTRLCSTVLAILSLAPYMQHTAQGQITWIRAYGGAGSDLAHIGVQTPDGGFLIAGATGSFGTGGDIYLMKVDAEGEREWSRNFGGAAVKEAWGLAATDEGYFIVGTSSSGELGGYDGTLIHIDPTGEELWTQYYGTADWDLLYSVATTNDHIYLVGKTYGGPLGNSDCWVIKTDLEGNEIWSRTIGGSFEDEGRDIQVTADGGCVIAGSLGQDDGTSEAYLVKLDDAGAVEWDSSFGTPLNDRGRSVTISSTGTYLFGGSSNGFSAFYEMFLAELDQTGAVIWTNHTGQISDWEGFDILERTEGGLAMVGYTTAFGLGGKDVYLLLTDDTGNFTFGATYGGGGDDIGYSLTHTDDGGFLLAGSTTSFGPGPSAMFVIRTGPEGTTESTIVEESFDPISVREISPVNTWTIAPNPVVSGGRMTVTVRDATLEQYRLFDPQGRELKNGDFKTGNFIDIGYIRSGNYGIELIDTNGMRSFSRFMVLNP